LIDYAATLGHTITFNDIYGTEGSAQAEAEPVDPITDQLMAEAAKAGLIERRDTVRRAEDRAMRKALKAAVNGA
jgi:ribosomal protein S3